MFRKPALLLSLLVAACTAHATPTFVGSFGGSDYYRTNTAMNFLDSQTVAESIGGNLATVNDAAENAYLAGAFSGALYWIGLNDIVTEGVYEWVSGEAVTYTNWGSGEPNDLNNEDGVHFNFGGAGVWNDIPISFNYLAIIEVTQNVPASASGALLLLAALCLRRRKLG